MIIMSTTDDLEPISLKKGKEFHKIIQKEWLNTAEGIINPEKIITKPSGKTGRIDIFVKSNEKLVAVVEIKNSNWNSMTKKNVIRNVNRQANQIWDYIESQLKLKKEVSPGIIFPKRPRDKNRMILIEGLFEERGISVVWEDESITECKARY
jgi:Holliday junction resolvase-like predicted endonuclease